jgi:small subunit ribosomal protein S1
MSEKFSDLFEASLVDIDLRSGAIISATVVEVRPDRITVNAGLKSDAIIPIVEFGGKEVAIGEEVDVVIDSLENGFGETRLSYEKAIRVRAWRQLQTKHDQSEIVMGVITGRVKGGFTVDVENLKAFLPGSLVDVKPIRDPSYLEGKELEFKVVKMDEKRNNIVVSRRAVMEAETSVERQQRLDELQEGQEVMGIVKNITDYGAFVDLGGVDGLLHITDMAWKRIKHPSEVMNVGDELKVKILKFDREKSRVSLGIKQLGEDPWANIGGRYPEGARLRGVITNVTDYGCFVELETGVEGLVHMSEMDWTNKNIHPSKVVRAGEETEVVVLGIDEDRRRISLGIKQCKSNPWSDFSEGKSTGDKVSGKIRSITDFGVFIGLNGGIDGLVHLSDISWTQSGEQAIRNYKKGDELEAVILAIDADRERISLGIKQLSSDPIEEYINKHGAEGVVSATVTEVDPKFALLELAEGMISILKIADFSHDHTESLVNELKVGAQLEVRIIGVDKKTSQVQVSHKVLDELPANSSKSASSSEATNTTLGDLLKEHMDKSDKSK